ncbi:MAG: SPOR domain-containing protein, partial [Rhodobacteraceae bacterium]|nr:SPOR domain-containing protein [Paracoccaceae bacterium]
MTMCDDKPTGDVGLDIGPVPFGRVLYKVTNLVAAAVSLLLIIGVGVWSYKLIMRDVRGIPIVRAVEGPMRVQPEHPGGQPVDHQGLAVNEVVAQGTVAVPADRLILAPRPVLLLDEDQPSEQLDKVTVATNFLPDTQAVDPAEAVIISNTIPVVFHSGSIGASVDALSNGVASLDPPPGTKPHIVVEGLGHKQSVRPLARPASLVKPVFARTVEVPAATLEVEPTTLPAGTNLIQLGTYDSAA